MENETAKPRITAEMLLAQLEYAPGHEQTIEILRTAIVNARADGHDEYKRLLAARAADTLPVQTAAPGQVVLERGFAAWNVRANVAEREGEASDLEVEILKRVVEAIKAGKVGADDTAYNQALDDAVTAVLRLPVMSATSQSSPDLTSRAVEVMRELESRNTEIANLHPRARYEIIGSLETAHSWVKPVATSGDQVVRRTPEQNATQTAELSRVKVEGVAAGETAPDLIERAREIGNNIARVFFDGPKTQRSSQDELAACATYQIASALAREGSDLIRKQDAARVARNIYGVHLSEANCELAGRIADAILRLPSAAAAPCPNCAEMQRALTQTARENRRLERLCAAAGAGMNTSQQAADEIALIIKWMRDNEPVTVSQIAEVLRNREGVNRIEAIRQSRSAVAAAPVDGAVTVEACEVCALLKSSLSHNAGMCVCAQRGQCHCRFAVRATSEPKEGGNAK